MFPNMPYENACVLGQSTIEYPRSRYARSRSHGTRCLNE